MFFLFILIFVLVLGLAIHTSRIGIEIQNLIIDTEAKQKINKEYKIYIYLVIFKKIKIFKKNIKEMKPKNIKFQNKDVDIEILKNKNLKMNYKDIFKNIDIDVEKINLYAQIGTQDAALTAILVGFISGIIGILIRKPKYQIIPIYSNKNLLKIKLDGIFSIYLMQYIYKLIFNKIKDLKKTNLEKVEV